MLTELLTDQRPRRPGDETHTSKRLIYLTHTRRSRGGRPGPQCQKERKGFAGWDGGILRSACGCRPMATH